MGEKSSLLLLASLAWKAYQAHQQNKGDPQSNMNANTQLLSGMREPKNKEEEKAVNETIFLMLKAMINAAKADGKIDETEMAKILGKAKENGMNEDEQQFIMTEINKPMDTESLINAVSTPQMAAQIYSVSLLAIDQDTEAEELYLKALAKSLALSDETVSFLKLQLMEAV
jgi:uncharacterized membrane protein YebE (DUF533 family)